MVSSCAALLVLLVLVHSAVSSYEWRAVALGPGADQVTEIKWSAPQRQNDTDDTPLAVATRATYTRRLSDFEVVSPHGYAAAFDKASDTIFTISGTATGWRVCSWKRTGDPAPSCSAQIATLADGTPTCMTYLGATADVLIVAFPVAGKIVSLRGRGLSPFQQPWAEPAGMPVHMAVDEAHSIVYVALLNLNRVVRYDLSGTALDADDEPWLLVPRPRFVVLNKLANGNNTFYVMSLDADAPELHLFDAHGNSLGSIRDTVGQWVCDEPGGPPHEPADGEYIPRVVSLAVDDDWIVYALKNNRHAQVDEYSFYTGLPRAVDVPLFVKEGVALVPNEPKSEPLALVDSYSFTTQEGRHIFAACEGGGNTLDAIRGVWPCGNTASTLVYDDTNVYLLDSDGCFSAYVYYCHRGVACVHDTFLDADGALYVLKIDGETLQIDSACSAPSEGTLVINGTLDHALLAVPGTDYFVFDGTPCLSTSQELICAGSQRVEIEGSTGPVTYISATKTVMVVPEASVVGSEFLQLQTVSLETGEQTGRWLASPSPHLGKLLVDRASGNWGLIDIVTGQLYQYNQHLDDAHALELVSGNLSGPFEALVGWAMHDPLGPSVRYPAPTTTNPPHHTKTSRKTSVGLIVGLTVSLTALLLFTCAVFCIAIVRRRHSKAWEPSKAPGIAPAVTYGSAEIGGTTNTYWISPRVRYWLREIFCPCSFCYSSTTQRLRCCSNLLGGRRVGERSCFCLGKSQPYSQFVDDPSLTGEGAEMPEIGREAGAEEAEPVDPAQSGDRATGDSGVLTAVPL